MLDDATKARQAEGAVSEDIKVLDVAQVLEQSLALVGAPAQEKTADGGDSSGPAPTVGEPTPPTPPTPPAPAESTESAPAAEAAEPSEPAAETGQEAEPAEPAEPSEPESADEATGEDGEDPANG
jgi:hypothetical protein